MANKKKKKKPGSTGQHVNKYADKKGQLKQRGTK